MHGVHIGWVRFPAARLAYKVEGWGVKSELLHFLRAFP